MNRRSFLARVFAAPLLAAAISLRPVSALAPPALRAPGAFVPLTYRGVPIVYDRHCPPGRIYLVGSAGLLAIETDRPGRWEDAIAYGPAVLAHPDDLEGIYELLEHENDDGIGRSLPVLFSASKS